MWDRLDTIWCYTRDMNRAVVFYRDVLGLPLVYESAHWSSFSAGEARLGLHLTSEEIPAGSSAGWCVGFGTPDIRALRERLIAAGADVAAEYHEIPGGVVLDIRDPDGNRLQGTQRGISLEELGGVV